MLSRSFKGTFELRGDAKKKSNQTSKSSNFFLGKKMDDKSALDRFADPLDSSFISFVSHPVAEHAETATEDFGGLLERLCLFDYRDFMQNPVCRGLQFMLTETKDYVPNVDARFVFIVLLSMEKSVQDLIEQDLQEHVESAKSALQRYQREQKLTFYRDDYLYFVKQTVNRLIESNFNQDNAENLIEMTLTKLQATWLREDMAEILSARANWSEMDRVDSLKVRRTTAERSSEKKRTNNQRNQERKEFNRRLISGDAEYWKKSNNKKE